MRLSSVRTALLRSGCRIVDQIEDIGRELWHHRIRITLPADTWVMESLWDMVALPDGRIALTGQTWYGVQKNTWRHDLRLRTILDP